MYCHVISINHSPCPSPSLSKARVFTFTLAVAAVSEFSVFGDLQFGWVGGRDAVPRLHAVAILQLRQSAH